MTKRALISVSDKEGIFELASFLHGKGWEIISTGGTSGYLKEKKIPVTEASSVTGFPECLDGRVKTLHPAIHAGILARRDEKKHLDELLKLGISEIDLICVNLYPFFGKVQKIYSQNLPMNSLSKPGATNKNSLRDIIEFIDIGGPAMLRSAAKNFRDVIVLTDCADYAEAISRLKSGDVTFEWKKRLAAKAFDLTSAYDAAIARFLLDEEYPEYWALSLKKKQNLRYGENSHQSAALYAHTDASGVMGNIEQLHGKELGYNNIRDLDLAWKAVCAFGLPSCGLGPVGEEAVKALVPDAGKNMKICCAAIKHSTPCGIALGDTLAEAFEKTLACDPVSIYGGIIASNVTFDAAAAKRLAGLFLEIIAAPDFEPEALEILKSRKNLRIIKMAVAPLEALEYTAVDGGLLVQRTDRKLLEKWEVVTRIKPENCDITDMIFGMCAVTYVKSNGIIIVRDQGATGIGGGQVNRIWSALQALERSAAVTKDSSPARVLASDGFFPFPDVVEAAAAAGIKAIIQPGGSINDGLSIEACDKHGIAMVFTGTRHFKH